MRGQKTSQRMTDKKNERKKKTLERAEEKKYCAFNSGTFSKRGFYLFFPPMKWKKKRKEKKCVYFLLRMRKRKKKTEIQKKRKEKRIENLKGLIEVQFILCILLSFFGESTCFLYHHFPFCNWMVEWVSKPFLHFDFSKRWRLTINKTQKPKRSYCDFIHRVYTLFYIYIYKFIDDCYMYV